MSQPYLGEIRMFGGNFNPRGWAFCNGQILAISQNAALFSLLGTTYGGNGTSTFALPNMQGRYPMHWGNGAGLNPVVIGEMAGTNSVTILTSNLPQHNHSLNITNAAGTQPDPTGALIAQINTGSSRSPTFTTLEFATGSSTGSMAATAIGFTGSNIPLSIQNPFLAVSFIIATQGIFPSRN